MSPSACGDCRYVQRRETDNDQLGSRRGRAKRNMQFPAAGRRADLGAPGNRGGGSTEESVERNQQ